MIALLKIDIVTKEIIGWIIAPDIDSARQDAYNAGFHDLATELYQMTFAPQGKTQLRSGFLMLV